MSTKTVPELILATKDPTDLILLTKDLGGGIYSSNKITVSSLLSSYKTIFIPSIQITPRSNNGCSIGSYESPINKIHLETLDFDPDLPQYGQFNLIMPEDWDLGTVKVKFVWFADTGVGNTIWSIQARAMTNDDIIDGTFGTAVTATGTLTTLLDMEITGATGAMTIGNSPALGDMINFQIYRDANNGSDTLTGNARLLGVWIQYLASSIPTVSW